MNAACWAAVGTLCAAGAASIDDIAAQVGLVSHDEIVARVEAYLTAHPEAADADRGLLLAAQLSRADGHDSQARALLGRVSPHSP